MEWRQWRSCIGEADEGRSGVVRRSGWEGGRDEGSGGSVVGVLLSERQGVWLSGVRVWWVRVVDGVGEWVGMNGEVME